MIKSEWAKMNEAEIKETIKQIKLMQSPTAIHECDLVTFDDGKQDVSLTAWDAIVALCLVLGVPVEYVRKATK